MPLGQQSQNSFFDIVIEALTAGADTDPLVEIPNQVHSLLADFTNQRHILRKANKAYKAQELQKEGLQKDIAVHSLAFGEIGWAFKAQELQGEITVPKAQDRLKQAEDYYNLANFYAKQASSFIDKVGKLADQAKGCAIETRRYINDTQALIKRAQDYASNAKTPAEKDSYQKLADCIQEGASFSGASDCVDRAQRLTVDIWRLTFDVRFLDSRAKSYVLVALYLVNKEKVRLAEAEKQWKQLAEAKK
jgi:hypothetical protein